MKYQLRSSGEFARKVLMLKPNRLAMGLALLLGVATTALADGFGSYGKGRVVAAAVKVRCSPSDIMTVKQELREHIYAVTCADKTTVIVRCTPQKGCKAGC